MSQKHRRSVNVRSFVEPLEARQLLASFVIEISVDGLRPDAVTTLGQSQVPNFYRLINQGSWTNNARADYNYTETSPNHTDIQTACPVTDPTYGHNVSINVDDGTTVHAKAGRYVCSTWDIVHDNGLRTGFYASKDKFAFFDRSWNATNGRVDPIAPDNGRDKIDTYLFNATTSALTNSFLGDMAANPYTYSLVHYADPDVAGHASGWMSTTYLNAVKTVDGYLAQIFNMIDTNPTFTGNTDVIVVADHGGTGTAGHGDATLATNYTIPFFAWGPDVSAGGNLYTMNSTTRTNPGTGRPNNTATPQPIRHADGANLATDLLNLGALDGSLFNYLQDLAVLAVNQAPTANNDSYSTHHDTTLNVPAPGVLSNDTDPENNVLSAIGVTGPAHGSLTLNTNGSFVYTPTGGYIGADSFTYKANDGLLDSNVATVNINVQGDAQNFYAISEVTTYGTRTGSFANTTASDNSYESLKEVVSGKTSVLEHTWTFSISGGTTRLFSVEAYKTGTEDNFKFQYSTNGSTWTDMLTVTKTSDDNTPQTYNMPDGITGTVYIRVLDTNRANNKKVLDTIFVDHMFIRCQ